MFTFNNNEMMTGSNTMTQRRSWEDRPMHLTIDRNIGISPPRADFMISSSSNALPKAPKMRRIESRSEGQLSPCLNMRFNEDRLNMPLIRESSQDSGSSLFRGSSHFSEIKIEAVNREQLQLPARP